MFTATTVVRTTSSAVLGGTGAATNLTPEVALPRLFWECRP
jgi:hypothetical protein